MITLRLIFNVDKSVCFFSLAYKIKALLFLFVVFFLSKKKSFEAHFSARSEKHVIYKEIVYAMEKKQTTFHKNEIKFTNKANIDLKCKKYMLRHITKNGSGLNCIEYFVGIAEKKYYYYNFFFDFGIGISCEINAE